MPKKVCIQNMDSHTLGMQLANPNRGWDLNRDFNHFVAIRFEM